MGAARWSESDDQGIGGLEAKERLKSGEWYIKVLELVIECRRILTDDDVGYSSTHHSRFG